MNNKLIPIVLMLVVGIILAGSVLVPVLNDATETERTFTNNGIIRMDKVDDTLDTTIAWDHTNPDVVTIGGVEKAMPQDLTIALTIGGADDFFIRYSTNSVTVFHNNAVINASVSDTSDLSITIAAGTITSSNGTNSDTFTYTDDLFIVSDTGAYVMKNMNDTVYVKKDSDIHGYGRTYLEGGINTAANFNINGNVDDGFTVEPWGTAATLTVGDITVTDEPATGYIDLYKFTKIEFEVSDGSHDTTATYGQVIVPYQVTAELSEHLTPGQIALMGTIPVLVIVALLVVAVGVVARRND